MREIMIKYNPYRLETDILVDGAAPKQNSRLNFADRRLQEWIEGLPEILVDECSTRAFKLTFHGTILDYEDVEAMTQEARKAGINIELTHIPAKEVSDKEAVIDKIFNEIQAGPFDELKKSDVIKAFKMARSSDFEVDVVATMSAGKSTLINALLQQKLMPAKQEACTAKVTEIKDNDSDHFAALVYNSNGQQIASYPELTFETMSALNDDPEVFKVHIEGDIPFVTSEDVSLVLVDTPGPNNSRDPAHQEVTQNALQESSKALVLYIMNATQLAVNDDKNLLEEVANSMRVGGKQSRDRFIFVVNKLDDFRKGEDSVDAALNKVRDYLRDNGIENPNIYPASALTALNIRTILDQSDDEDDDEVYETKGKVRKFNRNPEMHFETRAPLSPSAQEQLKKRLDAARDGGNVNEEALIHCGVIPIEMAIQMYVRKYAKTAKIKNIVDTFEKRLESARSFETTKQKIAKDQDKQKEILRTIDTINRKLASGEEAKKFKDQVNKINYDSEIKKMAENVILDAQRKITSRLSSADSKMSKKEADVLCDEFARFADDLQTKVKVKLENAIKENVYQSASDLLKKYKKKLSELAQDIEVGDVPIDPFKMMQGEISTDISTLINSATETESVKVDEVWVENTSKKWYKPWTWLQERGHWKSIYEDREFVDGTQLAQRFFAPVEERLRENSGSAVKYAKEQTEKVKKAFSQKFTDLDDELKRKLKELEDCANNNRNIEQQIRESQAKLKWLEEIQEKTRSILDI